MSDIDFKDKKSAVMVVLKEFGLDSSAVWNCHGTPVILHKALERVADKAGIRFDPPVIVETNAEKKIAVISVTGTRGDNTAWSFGEAMPSNNKNAYPFAMAEKRAKDRVILKLIGLSGDAYSEEEADDFKSSKPVNTRKSKANSRDLYKVIQQLIDDAPSLSALFDVWKNNQDAIKSMPVDFEDTLTQRKDDKKHELTKRAA